MKNHVISTCIKGNTALTYRCALRTQENIQARIIAFPKTRSLEDCDVSNMTCDTPQCSQALSSERPYCSRWQAALREICTYKNLKGVELKHISRCEEIGAAVVFGVLGVFVVLLGC